MGKVRIKKEDQVVVISGKDRDLTKPRRVLQVMRAEAARAGRGRRTWSSGTRAPNPQQNIKGGIVEREAPIHVSNVMLWSIRRPSGRPGSAARCWKTARGCGSHGAAARCWTSSDHADRDGEYRGEDDGEA